ncbi:squamosa promoter-binding-like protein 14 isoform X2 [Phalaenopsis equestris]|uniref:squamosa promoter-binding-like protein 14 isoform X2 n=1 Tax=Phalaenopsis equestris TaxID=78828 RepID=UPI0009E50BE6|nr:squamosa promoter-binding-like protein 14 isoform X2 [Phalaenopsis equestris]
MDRGSSSRAGSSGDAFKGLQFGKKISFDDVSGAESSSKSGTAPASPDMRQLVAGRKAKGAAQGCGQPLPPPRCQVEGCNLDLKGAKSYYCRHKVCGMHSKSPKVIVAGLEQRFCQQCSRFHLLKEFDQGKRSCRRRLAGHNERRRKPPPGLLPSHYDDSGRRGRGFLMDFMHPRPPDTAKNMLWPTMRSSDRVVTNQLQGKSIQSSGGVISDELPTLFSVPELAPGDCIAGVSDSTCALSLLSTQPWDVVPASAATPSSELEMAQGSSYVNSSWAFKDHAAGSGSSHEMGFRQIQDAGNCHFSGELELAPQGSRHCPDDVSPSELYDHLHDLHWPL